MNFSDFFKKPQGFFKKSQDECEVSLKKGYPKMSRINLSLAEEAVSVDNEALLLAEQNLRSVNISDS